MRQGRRLAILPVMTPQSQPKPKEPVVVVVDDDPAVCGSLKFSLELEGFSVRTFRNGAELLREGDLHDCQCFVIDQRMPGMSGMDLIASLRERKVGTPAILVISQPSDALSGRAAKAAVPIVEKPLLSNMLVERIREACRLDR
jgi:two-component system response regulator FixJ